MDRAARLTLSRLLWADACFAVGAAAAQWHAADPILSVTWGAIFVTAGLAKILPRHQGLLFAVIFWQGVVVLYELLACVILLLIGSPG